MIIWISGPYGVGKSTLAEQLKDQMEDAWIFDAEAVGNAVRDNYPKPPYGVIFEDYPLWGEFCFQLLQDIHQRFQGAILVPMTLLRKDSYGLLERLQASGIDTKLIVLEASHQTVHDRILARGEKEGCWCMQNIEASRIGSSSLPGMHLSTDGRSIRELADLVLSALSE